MAVAADSSRRKRREPLVKQKRDVVTGLQWGVFIFSVLATPVAIHAASILALSGPDELMMLFPFVQIVKSPGMRIPADLANITAQWIMYLQFPLYGLIAAKVMRSMGAVGVGAAVALHCIGIAIAYLLAHSQNLRF
jgi:hypothetical protein